MKPFYEFEVKKMHELRRILSDIRENPYTDYETFNQSIMSLASNNKIPGYLVRLCGKIAQDRSNNQHVHVIRNCPIDENIPELNQDDPVNDKYKNKKTFISESFLALISNLLESPLLSYETRNNGDFFTDVIAINRFKGKTTGFTDSDLVYHNDRSAHPVRADYISLLGLRCSQLDLIYTNYIDSIEVLRNISKKHISILKQEFFYTVLDVFSKENNKEWIKSAKHPIILEDGRLRFQDTLTKVIQGAPNSAKDSLLAFKDAIIKSEKLRHRIECGDLFIFANQYGLHNRERIEVNDPVEARKRWLLKTYTFKNKETADKFSTIWVNGTYGCVPD